MLFNSIEFLFFLPVVFSLYWSFGKHRQIQNLIIVIASYFFYGWWDWRFLLLIAATSAFSFLSGLLLKTFDSNNARRKMVSAANILLNLAILALFKYYNFFAENLEQLLGVLGWHIDFVTLNIVLPVGISFYTFQALSYTIDVYMRKIEPTKDVVEFFAYISFFPQLVAGPIERATNLLPQFQRKRRFSYATAVDGMRQMLWGFVKKVLIADNCAYIVNKYWDLYPEFSGISLLALAILFSFQIYGDFSGYSDIAIGCSRLFGFDLKRNFQFPYFSRNIPDFWRRWHISLMTWFRDYVYFPLGGSRCSRVKTIRNIFVVWGISGLWHGANWTFVVWGLYHALLLAVSNLLGLNKKYQPSTAQSFSLVPSLREFLQMAVTFSLVVLGWIFFRASNISQAFHFISHMFATLTDSAHIGFEKDAIYLSLAMLLIEWLQRDKQHALQLPDKKPFNQKCFRWALYAILLVLVVCLRGQSQTFIYFQF